VARSTTDQRAAPAAVDRPICAIVLPGWSIDGCSGAHWAEVLEVLRTAAARAGFQADLRTAHQGGAIEQRVLQHRDGTSIAVFDLSGKDPDVMFELGLRLALDKPTIIIKDDRTSYLFDVDGVEHLEYPRDLHKAGMADFQTKLAESLEFTYRNATSSRLRRPLERMRVC
jgi:hypothetical protein